MVSPLTSAFLPALTRTRTYALAGLFVAGNIALPQLVHLVHLGGPMLLPIYFFTLIAAYRYGLATGLVTALASPLINHLLFGMPALEMLPVLLTKSVLLALAAAWVSQWMQARSEAALGTGKSASIVSIGALAIVVAAYQLPGTLAEYLFTGSWTLALQDFRIGLPGMALQIFGGWAVLKLMFKK